jgi:hypothetical protein
VVALAGFAYLGAAATVDGTVMLQHKWSQVFTSSRDWTWTKSFFFMEVVQMQIVLLMEIKYVIQTSSTNR